MGRHRGVEGPLGRYSSTYCSDGCGGYCKGTIGTTLFAASFVRLAVHRLCNTRVLLHPLHGNPSQNLAAKSAKQSKAARRALRRGEARRPCRAHGQGLQQSMSAPVSAFDRVRITPLQYSSLARKRALVKREKSAKKRSPEKETAFISRLAATDELKRARSCCS